MIGHKPGEYSHLSHANRLHHIWAGVVGDKLAIMACAAFIFYCVVSVLAPLIAPYDINDPNFMDLLNAEIAPYWVSGDERFLLGTDSQGRDLLSVILYGTRLSLTIGILAVAIQAFIGISIGLISGYVGGRVDSFLMRFADVQLSFSTIMTAIVFLAIFQATFGVDTYEDLAMLMLILVIGLAEWPLFARTIRASVLAEKQKEYIDAARVMGIGKTRIMFRHILPNTLTPVLVIFTIQIANAIIAEAALSFLGLGMPSTEPSLGALISSGFRYLFSGAWWICVIPSVALIGLILVMNLLGDWLRDYLNPRTYKQ
ncbi:ABC transporter permease [Marinomonas mediterranea]|jgi:ABC-type dipeptide/oligopeptide/nickel transport systems, permease components|uniref:ABC-type transporter, integral membrane subunit n=1 Tax=Marinomonas mediterranea (strain ATCC 700492 / JCM 21426 / NBRC 103028 / MMB-1) TaxID=717774 RepID=F2JZX4_MARM1|nr:ABC transporter permease [Marinomonas mediterranea]ADZ92086.1 ABC-type transporter, integral membrane subunit [Marinomonas mediterranea MMB-1]WCN10048.1 ABC transporter permease subunit [Marinomonas mediterranea]WCN14098.1 ABC transporter permease subunit [Marinomonas mediterranea]WCN18154.1 ABC transporter permease subunit [Marinomonas mediterranea MMB-1]